MAYRVKITQRAEEDPDATYVAIRAEHSEAAMRWYLCLKRAISGLKENPLSFPVTPETRDLRHLLYGKKPHIYRVIYRVIEAKKEIEVLHVRHGARDRFQAGEFPPD